MDIMDKIHLFSKPHQQITLTYFVIASLWILLSDYLLQVLNINLDSVPIFSMLKGIGFVIITSVLIYLHLRHEFEWRAEKADELQSEVERVKQFQSALIQSELRFRKAIENAPLPIMIFAEDGEVISISQSWLEITGYIREQIKTLDNWTQLAYGENQKTIKEVIDRLFDLDQRVDEGEFQIRCNDGQLRIWAFSSTPLGQISDNRRIVISIAADVTERKNLEEKIRQREHNFRHLFESNPHPMWVFDRKTMAFLEVNDAAIAHYGYSREEFLSMTILDIRPEEYHAALRKQFEHTPQKLIPAGIWKHQVKDGRLIDVDIRAHTLEFAGKDASLVVATDVTEVERARVELHRSNQFLELLIHSSPLGIVMFTDEGIVKLWNPALEEILGWKADEVIGHTLPYIRDEDQSEFAALRGRVAMGDTFRGEIVQRQRKDGVVLELSISAGPLYDLSDKFIGVVGIIKDATERKRLESVLQESELRFRQLAESIHEVFYLNDSQKNTILYVSPAYEKIWGRSCESLYENPLSFLQSVHEDDRESVIASFAEQRAGRPVEVKYRVVQPNHTIRWVRSRAFPVLEEDGTFHRIAGIAEDITELVQYEERLRRLAQRLVTLLDSERTRIARELHDQIGQQLTGLQLNLDIIQMQPDLSERVNSILGDSSGLIGSIMDHIRNIITNLRPPILDDMGLTAGLRWYMDRFSRRTGITVTFENDLTASKFTPNIENTIFQVVQEALTNVSKHAQASMVLITLQYIDQRIILRIKDNGKGFELETRNASNTQSWGIQIMRERVQTLVGSTFQIESNSGKGTEIVVELQL
jgi:PAS domain S-box-containing protein